MAKTTFSGPVQSLAGFISAGYNNTVTLDTNTTALTLAANAGKQNVFDDADGGTITLPAINAVNPTDATDPNQASNLGASFTLTIATTLTTDLVISAAGSDVFTGSVLSIDTDDDSVLGFVAGATDNTITLDGTTTGGIAGSQLTITAVSAGVWNVSAVLAASGTVATPFSAV